MANDDPINQGETPTPPIAETLVINMITDAALGALLYVF
jgi:hypothetical protein